MTVVTITNIKYINPTEAETELVFGFDEAVDQEYLESELKAHIEEQTEQLVESFEYEITQQDDQE